MSHRLVELDKLRLATRKEEEDAIGKGGADPSYIGNTKLPLRNGQNQRVNFVF